MLESPFKGKTGVARVFNALGYSLDGLKAGWLNEAAFRQHLTYDFYKAWMARSKDWRHSENRIRHVLDFVYGPDHADSDMRQNTGV